MLVAKVWGLFSITYTNPDRSIDRSYCLRRPTVRYPRHGMAWDGMKPPQEVRVLPKRSDSATLAQRCSRRVGRQARRLPVFKDSQDRCGAARRFVECLSTVQVAATRVDCVCILVSAVSTPFTPVSLSPSRYLHRFPACPPLIHLTPP